MVPSELMPEQFAVYPPEARTFAADHVTLLRRLPLAFVPLVLRELIALDWKFPLEREEMYRQFAYLGRLSPEQLTNAMRPFSELRLNRELERVDWVNAPNLFSEQLSAHLWATHQIDQFRAAAVEYMDKVNATASATRLQAPRLGIVLIGEGVAHNTYPLFRKLRSHGVYFSKVRATNGRQAVLDAVASRAKKHPGPYAHWHIDGGTAERSAEELTVVSYAGLTPVRGALQARMRKWFDSGVGSEALRTMLAQMRPEDLGLSRGVLHHFELSLLSEGAGTQVFSTSFVQWAAREALRRAQPITLYARFAPRQQERSMRELLTEAQGKPALDPQGSLIDADMGAYYTWLNQQRLSGADESRFLVWFEDHSEAVVLAPSLPKGSSSGEDVDLQTLLDRVG
jgi:hypothetical protein